MAGGEPHTTLDKQLSARLSVLVLLAAAMWGLLVATVFLPEGKLDYFAIRPKTNAGLLGIPLAPFLHRDAKHLASNTLPFVVLGGLVLMRSWRDFLVVSLVSIGGSGAGTWYFGSPDEVHLGASGLVFGYLGFLLARGLFERSLIAIIIALAVGFSYGSLIWSVFPNEPNVSWQAHLFGFISGVVCGRLLRRR